MTSAHGRLPCQFQLLRYVSDPVRNEFVHFGVLVRESAAREAAAETDPPSRFALRFTRDWRRLRCMDPDADTTLLESLESDLRQRLELDTDGKLQRILDESLSLNVQMTAPKAYLAESLPAGVEELMRLYIDPPPRERAPRLAGRAAIHAKMRTEFERAGVWDLLRKRIAASEYTRPGDPLRLDAGYRPNGTSHPTDKDPSAGTPFIRMFHAVSLEPGVEMAKVLAFSAASLRAGVERVEHAALDLAAIIEPAARLGATDDDPDRLALYRFGVETMEEHNIRVLTTSDLSRIADTARRELHV